MTILVQDSFNRANSTTGLGVADSGQSWQSLAGGWGISNNQAYWISGNPAISIIESGKSDVSISLDNIVASAGQSSGAVAFRITDDKNYWLFRNISGTNQLYKFVNGSATLVASKLYSLAEGVFKFKVVATSATIECYVNDILELTTTDTHNQTATRHGLRNHTGTTTRFDNFIIESLGIGGGDTGEDGSVSVDTKQILYQDGANLFDIRNILYQDGSTSSDTKQVLYQISSTSFDMLQEIFNDGQVGQTPFDMRFLLYSDGSILHDSLQALYESGQNVFDLSQAIYEAGESKADIHLALFADSSTHHDLIQSLYEDAAVHFDTKQISFNPDQQKIGTIRLKGKRDLYVYLVAKQELNVPLKAKRELTVSLKGGVNMTMQNQNFSMCAGDTKYITFTIEGADDLTGATITWGARQRSYSSVENIITKSTGDGITVEGSEVKIKLDPADTELLSGTYHHECELKDNLNNVSTVFTGLMTVNKSGV